MDVIKLQIMIEEQFGIVFDDEMQIDFYDMTVGDIAKCVVNIVSKNLTK